MMKKKILITIRYKFTLLKQYILLNRKNIKLNLKHKRRSTLLRSDWDWNCCITKPKADYFCHFLSLPLHTHAHLTCSHREEPQVGDRNKGSWWQHCARGGRPRPTPTSTLTQLGPKSFDPVASVAALLPPSGTLTQLTRVPQTIRGHWSSSRYGMEWNRVMDNFFVFFWREMLGWWRVGVQILAEENENCPLWSKACPRSLMALI